MKLILSLLFFSVFSVGHATEPPDKWFSYDVQKRVNIQVSLFLSSTCPHCHKADAFFRDLEKKEPWLIVHRYVINQDKFGLQKFYEQLQQQNSNNFSVPAIFFCNSRWAGFADQNSTGKVLFQALSYCRQKITEQGQLSPETINALQKWGNASQIEISQDIRQSAFALIPLTALSDVFNPCSFFCLAAFLAFLWLYPTQKWHQFYLGLIFLLSQGLVHFVQQAYSAGYYQIIPKFPVMPILVGILLFAFALRSYPKEKSQVSLSMNIWVFAIVILTSGAVQIFQQTCALNLALFFERWLTEQNLSTVARLIYQIFYQIFYLLPLFLLLLFYFLFGRRHWLIRHQQALKVAACLILGSIGLILLIYRTWLAHLWFSIVVFLGAIGVGLLVERRYEQNK